MRIDPATTDIHDLTDDEAADLLDLCERMLRGPVDFTHPLLVAWAEGCGFDDTRRLLAMHTAFLPRALYALRRRTACEPIG